MEFNMCIDKSLFLKYSNFIKEISGGVIMFENLTPDGKIKTIRYLKATHDDFAKLVKEGKKMKAAAAKIEYSELSENFFLKDIKSKTKMNIHT